MTREFVEAWTRMTEIIYEYEGSYGSRLHRGVGNLFIGYAQWPDRDTWNASGKKLPKAATEVSAKMRECCEQITTVYELSVVKDLLNNEQFRNS